MTIMGKILVILNLVAALLVGGILVYDSATRPDWKKAAANDKREATVAKSTTYATKMESLAVKTKYDALKNEQKNLQDKLDKLDQDYKKELADKADENTKLKKQAEESLAVMMAVRAQASRLSTEVKIHQRTVTEREATIVALEGKNKNLLDRAVQAENARDALNQRNQALVSQMEVIQKQLVKAEAEGGGTGGAVVRDSNAKNPPPVFVRGTVTQVLRDRGLVEISLGSDQGVNEGNTMEVYRLRPKPEYLGTIKILDAHHTRAVGRLLKPAAGVRHSPVVKGDEVASKILTR